jgi:methyltransferase (TIGR00027 family)
LPIAASRTIVHARDSVIISDPLAAEFLQGHEHFLLQHASSNSEYTTIRFLIGGKLVLKQHAQGVRQVVSLGSGMDWRAFRLHLPGTTFYEVDKANLFELKESLAKDVPLTYPKRKSIVGTLGAMDLGESLQSAGFDPEQPTRGTIALPVTTYFAICGY